MKRILEGDLREQVLSRDGYACRYCGDKRGPFHLDHVYPFVKGGETTPDNLVTACEKCNQRKHDSVGMWPKPIGYFEEGSKYTWGVLFAILLGVLLLANGAIISNKGQHALGSILFTIGLALSIPCISYLMTRRWRS